MSYFVFNGIKSDDLGLIIPSTPFRPSWSEERDEITIPGRPETIYQPTGHYESQTLTIKAVISDMSRAKEIYKALHGKGKLILSTALNEYMNVLAVAVEPSSVALDMAEIDIDFECLPFAYAIEPSETAIGKSYTLVNNVSSIYSAPRFEFKLAEVEEPILKGDVNFDGRVDSSDAAMVSAEYARIQSGQEPTFTEKQNIAADINGDGKIDSSDVAAIIQKYIDTQGQQQAGGATSAQDIQLDVNGAILNVGIPTEALTIGAKVVVDCGLYLIYYEDANGEMVNIMQYSSMDLPLLHSGENYVKYTGDNITSAKCIINERWL